jgi:chromosome segregation ATPase
MSPDLSTQESTPVSSDLTVDAVALQRAAGALFQTLQRANEQHQRLQKMMQVVQPGAAATGQMTGMASAAAAMTEALEQDVEPLRPQVQTLPPPTRIASSAISPGAKPNMYSVDNWLTRRLEQFHEIERRIEAREQKVQRLHLALGQVVTEMQSQVKASQDSRNTLQRLIEDGRQWALTAGDAAQQQMAHAQQRFEQYLKVLSDADEALTTRIGKLQTEAATLLDPMVKQLQDAAGALVQQQVAASQTEIEQRFGELETVLVTRLQEQLNRAQASVLEIEERANQVRSHVEQTQQQADSVVQVVQDSAPMLQSHLDQLQKHRDEHSAAITEEVGQARVRMDELAKQFQEQTAEHFEQVQDWLLQQGRQLRQQIDSMAQQAQETLPQMAGQVEHLGKQREEQAAAIEQMVADARARMEQMTREFQQQVDSISQAAQLSAPQMQDQVEELHRQRDEQAAALAQELGQARARIDDLTRQFQEQTAEQLEQVQDWLLEQGRQLRQQAMEMVKPLRSQMDEDVQQVEQRARQAIQTVRDHAHRFATALDSSVARMELRGKNVTLPNSDT